jgi:hypothetical protein
MINILDATKFKMVNKTINPSTTPPFFYRSGEWIDELVSHAAVDLTAKKSRLDTIIPEHLSGMISNND